MTLDVRPHHPATETVSSDAMIEDSFRDHWAEVRGKALRLTRDPETAADVTQEAFLRLFEEARAGRMPDNARAWLHRTTSNLIISRARHAAVEHRFAAYLRRDDTPAQPEAVVVLREAQDAVRALLDGLCPADRAIVLMAAHGATGQEMARFLGRTPLAARAALFRARRRLRDATGAQRSPLVAGDAPATSVAA